MTEFDFKNPDYDAIFSQRAARLKKIRKTPGMLAGLKAHYKDNPVDFINDWGTTFDPRNVEIDLPADIPFILFPRQVEFVDWVIEKWRGRDNGLAEKSRDMGISWLCVAIAHWMWAFYDDSIVGFGSRKEEYVDKLGDPKSLFWKFRAYVRGLPKEFRPREWNENKYAPFMRIINPENGASVVGEAGENIGRGNRTSIYFKDESAFYDRAMAIDAALSQTSNCQIDVSTANGNGNVFYRKRHSGKVDVFTFDWRSDPRKDDAWYAEQKRKFDPVVVASEIDIDYNASTNDSFIDGEKITAAMKIGPADVDPSGGWIIGIDAAHYGDDEHVIHFRRGRLNLPQITRRKIDGSALAALVTDEIKNAGIIPAAIVIELDGPGVSCYDHLKNGEYSSKLVGVHTGAKLSDGRNYNVRARMWRLARDYLNEGGVSLADDPELKSQISAVKFRYKDGLLLMQSKKEYKKEYGRSPDRADAFVLSFCADGMMNDSFLDEPQPERSFF